MYIRHITITDAIPAGAGASLGFWGADMRPFVWGSRDDLLVALEAFPDRVHDYKRLLLLGILLQAARLYHLDRGIGPGGSSWGAPGAR